MGPDIPCIILINNLTYVLQPNFLLILNFLYFIIVLTLFIIDSTSYMPPKYTFLLSNFACLFTYLSIYLFIYVLHDFILLLLIFGIH